MIKTIGKIVSISLVGLMMAGALFLYGNAKSKQLVDSENLEALTRGEEHLERTCYDRYSLESTLFHPTKERFRSCEDCKHVDGFNPRNDDICFD